MSPKCPSRNRQTAFRDITAAILSLLALGCDTGKTISFKDEGKLCLYPATGAERNPFAPPMQMSYEANRGLDLTVVAPRCLGTTCSHDERTECTATVTGNTIEVKSSASIREDGEVCSADCGALTARCSTGPLPAGTYQVRHGATTMTITVPSMAVVPCGGTGVGG